MAGESRLWTRGPWHCWDMDEFGWHVFADKFGTRAQGQDCRLSIAEVHLGRSFIEPRDNYFEQVANAHLIAAAPETLEALADLAEAARNACDARLHPELTNALFEADAALAKAKGA